MGSVDYSAHICYHYMSVEETSPDKRISASLFALGLPIVQGAISTVLGVIGLAFAPSYLFVTFFKMIFLVILLGALHGLILLPVLLSLFGPGSCERSGQTISRSASSTTISLHSTKTQPRPSCYSVNLSLGTPGQYRKTDHMRYQGDLQLRQSTSEVLDFVPAAATKTVKEVPRLATVMENEEHPVAVGATEPSQDVRHHKKTSG